MIRGVELNGCLFRMKLICSFLCLPKETNQRKGTRVTGPAVGGMPCAPQSCRDVANSLRSNSATSLFGSFSGARLRANGSFLLPLPICPAVPRRRGRKKTRELSEGEARVFPRPAPGEKQGKPAGPGLAGVPFSCFFLWARKRRNREQQKGFVIFPGIPG